MALGSSTIVQKFRRRFIDHALLPLVPPSGRLKLKNLEAFRRREIETAVQLYLHVTQLGATMNDVAVLLAQVRKIEERQRVIIGAQDYLQRFREKLVKLTREEKKHLKAKRHKDRLKKRRRKK